MATEHNPEERKKKNPSRSPSMVLPSAPRYKKKRAIHFNPYRHLGYLFLCLSSRFSVAEDTLGSCQAFPKLMVPGLMALCRLDRLTGTRGQRLPKDTFLLRSAASSSSLFP